MVTIRKARARDYVRCVPLLTSLYHGDIGTDFEKTFDGYVRRDEGTVLLAESSQVVVGILIGSFRMDIDWEGKTARIEALVVSEKHRRMGIGKQLVGRFVAMARIEGCKAVKARIGMSNRQAQRFHKRQGFSRLATYEYVLDFL